MEKNKKLLRWLKFLVIVCIAIIVVEGIYIGVKIYQSNNNTVYVDTLSSIEKLKDGYLGSGSSDFKHSKYNKYSKDYQKAKLVKYDKNEKIVFESAYTKGYDSYFYDAKQTKDGYIAVGSAAYTKTQVKEKTKDGLIVIYDKNGKQINSKTLQIAGDTKFTKVVVMDDGYLVIGQSILENMTIGNDPDGGAIMVKYDFDLKENVKISSNFTNAPAVLGLIIGNVNINDYEIYPACYFYENAKGQRFMVYSFVARTVLVNNDGWLFGMFRKYSRQRQLIDGVKWLQKGRGLPAVSPKNPQLYILCKKNGQELTIGLWNIFPDKILKPEILLDSDNYAVVSFYNCEGKIIDNKLILNDTIEAYDFAFIKVKEKSSEN